MREPREPRTAVGAEVSKYLGLGMGWALATLLFLFLGSLVDDWLGTAPWLTLIGAFVGAAAGFYSMIHHLVTVPRRRASEHGGEGERDGEGHSGRD